MEEITKEENDYNINLIALQQKHNVYSLHCNLLLNKYLEESKFRIKLIKQLIDYLETGSFFRKERIYFAYNGETFMITTFKFDNNIDMYSIDVSPKEMKKHNTPDF